MSQQATKLVIITEKLLYKHVIRIIDASGASGYTVIAASGKGSRNSDAGHPSVSSTFEKIKIEVITLDESIARSIADEVANNYFDNFSGIIFMDQIEVLYAHTL